MAESASDLTVQSGRSGSKTFEHSLDQAISPADEFKRAVPDPRDAMPKGRNFH